MKKNKIKNQAISHTQSPTICRKYVYLNSLNMRCTYMSIINARNYIDCRWYRSFKRTQNKVTEIDETFYLK
jgi:hypothetical protein